MPPTSDPLAWGDPELLVTRPVPGTSVPDRVRGAVRSRRVVPTSVALAGTDLLYRAATRASSSRRDYAERTMRAILPPGASEAEIARLAPLHVASVARAWELTWRPHELMALPVRGEEHLQDAAAAGRGVLISYAHYGPELGWIRAAPLLPMLVVLGDWIEGPTPEGYNGLQVEHRRTLLRDVGFQVSSANGSARRIMSVLGSGGAVLLAMDVPGPKVTRFLGKDVEMADGGARMAARTGALVVPGALVPDGRRWALEFQPALDPRDFEGPAQLHQATADVHSEIVLRAPEHLGSPVRYGFWNRADATGWFRE